ncbi:MAG: hypothetical protein OEO20_03640 [Gemmatimonadota bacterium]|nr:hypothetical protein [Gemmatimonadota bacterium]MDH3368876.1 hypothetical protein [Gemmatimonadota bacterium]MDH3477378.1 hypothetical protein [Gemmatimonadota bacterium]MDH3569766.1 hypothetical protein [Gemmatimonadota bacterium]MDH5548748.1 hypothetical protein [Gemmatimonadota bacterium]
MRGFTLTFLGLLCGAAPTARGQVLVGLDVGGMWTSDLAQDVIVNAISVAPALAPTIAVAVGTPISDVYSVGIRVRWAHSDVTRHELDADFTVLPLTVWTGTVTLERTLTNWGTVEGAVGAIKYAPGSDDRSATLFQDDAPLAATVGLGARARRPISPRWTLGAYLAYDVHQFVTQALRAGGAVGARTVHRVSGGISVYWSAR